MSGTTEGEWPTCFAAPGFLDDYELVAPFPPEEDPFGASVSDDDIEARYAAGFGTEREPGGGG